MKTLTVIAAMLLMTGCEPKPMEKPQFICPKCAQPSMAILVSMELGSDDYWDERTLQVIRCLDDGDEGLATYTESRSGSRETVRHQGKWVDKKELKKIRDSLEQCPSLRDSKCDCAAHEAARKLNLSKLPGEFFEMKLIH